MRGYQVSVSGCRYTRGETLGLMAAIIAQITRAKRERDRRVAEAALKDCKCHYHLPQFESTFNPKVHNKFVARQELIRLKREEEELFEGRSTDH